MRSLLFFVEVFILVVVTVAVRLIGNDEAAWGEFVLSVEVLTELLSKRNGDVLTTEATVLFTRFRANEGAIKAQEPNVCFGMACDKKIDVADVAEDKVAVAEFKFEEILFCIRAAAVGDVLGNFAVKAWKVFPSFWFIERAEDVIVRFKGSFSGSSKEKIACDPPLQAEANEESQTDVEDEKGGETEAAASVEEVKELFPIEVVEDDIDVPEVSIVVVWADVSKEVEAVDSLFKSSTRLL